MFAGEDEGPKIEVPRLDPVLHQRRRGREIENRLGHPVARVGANRRGHRLEFIGARPVADHDAVAAALVGRFDDEVTEVCQYVLALVVIHAAIRRDIRDQRLLSQVVPDHVGHPRVHDLVVGHACSRRIGDRHVSGLPCPHQASDTEHRVGQEHLGIDEEIVDAPIDHIDTLQPLDGLHVHAVVLADHEILTLDEFGAHPLRQERMLEVGGIVDAGREHDDERIVAIVGSEGRQQTVEFVGVRIDGADPIALEQLGERPLRDGSVLEHVAHPRRHAQVVLQHVELTVAGAHQVGAGDVRPHTEFRMDAPTLGPEVGRVVE